MSVGRERAERIAHLARLRFEEEELERITAELNHILAHVESLAALEPGGGEGSPGHLPTGGAPTVSECSPTRDARAEEPDALSRNAGTFAPDWREGFFAVPPLPGVHEGRQGQDAPEAKGT